jgi:hypothetical protein
MSNDELLVKQRQEDAERVTRHLEELGEHFDSVVILTTRHMPVEAENAGKVITTTKISGNWLTAYGRMKEWVEFEDERIRDHARRDERERLGE